MLPATRTLAQDTMFPRAMTATSDVPPPMLIIMCPDRALMGMPAPRAASTGSRTTNTFRAPASVAAFTTARRSVWVMPAGTEMITSGFTMLNLPTALDMK